MKYKFLLSYFITLNWFNFIFKPFKSHIFYPKNFSIESLNHFMQKMFFSKKTIEELKGFVVDAVRGTTQFIIKYL